MAQRCDLCGQEHEEGDPCGGAPTAERAEQDDRGPDRTSAASAGPKEVPKQSEAMRLRSEVGGGGGRANEVSGAPRSDLPDPLRPSSGRLGEVASSAPKVDRSSPTVPGKGALAARAASA